MTDKEKLAKIKTYIAKHYDPEEGAATELHSEGNYSDVFSDGADWGECHALYAIARIIGMDVEKPFPQNFD